MMFAFDIIRGFDGVCDGLRCASPILQHSPDKLNDWGYGCMTNYRRNYVAGGAYFFTVALAERQSSLLIDEIDLFRESFRLVRSEYPFHLAAMVVLPEHLHCIWCLPENDCDYSTRWKKIKAHFSMRLPKIERRSQSRLTRGERGIWQRRYWEHTIRNESDFQRHVDYIHYNPVKHGLVTIVEDWPYSTFHTYAERGVYPPGWGGVSMSNGGFDDLNLE
jgi:putative transposase